MAPPPRPLPDDDGAGGTVTVGVAVAVAVVSGGVRRLDAAPTTGGGVADAIAEATAADIAPTCAELIALVDDVLPDVAGTAMVPMAGLGLTFGADADGSGALVVALTVGVRVTDSEGSGATGAVTVGAGSLGAASLNHFSTKIPTPSMIATPTTSVPNKMTATIPPLELRVGRGGGAAAMTGTLAWLGDEYSGAGRGATGTWTRAGTGRGASTMVAAAGAGDGEATGSAVVGGATSGGGATAGRAGIFSVVITFSIGDGAGAPRSVCERVVDARPLAGFATPIAWVARAPSPIA